MLVDSREKSLRPNKQIFTPSKRLVQAISLSCWKLGNISQGKLACLLRFRARAALTVYALTVIPRAGEGTVLECRRGDAVESGESFWHRPHRADRIGPPPWLTFFREFPLSGLSRGCAIRKRHGAGLHHARLQAGSSTGCASATQRRPKQLHDGPRRFASVE